MNGYKWYTFEDGYEVCVKGFSRLEMQYEVMRHGKVVKVEPDTCF